MGFIRHAIISIALYEGIKYWISRHLSIADHADQIELGAKHYTRSWQHHAPNPAHRHHLDRPEIPSAL